MAEQQRRRRRVRATEPSASDPSPSPPSPAPAPFPTPTPTPAPKPLPTPTPAPSPSPTPSLSLARSPGPAPAAQMTPVHDEPWAGAAADNEAPLSERGLRGLVGGGSSQVSPTVALRARDAARPTPEDIARAEAELTIVRRHWSPRD